MKNSNIGRTVKTAAFFALVLTLTFAAAAENTLSLSRNSSTAASLILTNSEAVAGMQLTLNCSANVVLNGIDRDVRTAAEQWMVVYHKVNDTTVNVVIISSGLDEFAQGSGPVAKVAYAAKDGEDYRISMRKVVVANPAAQKMNVNVNDLTWKKNVVTADARSFSLLGSYPNPANPSTQIQYKLDNAQNIRLTIYDMTGREVARLIDGDRNAGTHSVRWDARDNNGKQVASGMYMARMQAGSYAQTAKIIIAR